MIARRGLFLKYVVVLVALVGGALLASGGIELWFSYQENKNALLAVQNEKAVGAAARIESFVREIERQMAWTTQLQLVTHSAAIEQRKTDFHRLQRQVAGLAITELAFLDAAGKEQIRVSRVAMEVIGSQLDLSRDSKFVEGRRRTWFGPVYFRKGSEPYMTIAMPVTGGGVVVAEVNLKFIWDVVSQIKVGKAGRAFVVDGRGDLIAHPDISLVLRQTSLGELPHVKAALARAAPGAPSAAVSESRDVQGRDVLTGYSVIPSLQWAVFVEQPIEEAFGPLRASITRTVVLIFLGVAVSLIASVVLARRMVQPIRAMQEGAARIGAGELGHRLDVRTGDELQALAGQFNEMTGRLQESYATLERRVEERTRALSEALEQQTATAEILRVISSSPTDVHPVFDTIVRSAAQLCDATFGGVFQFDGTHLSVGAVHNVAPELASVLAPAFPLGLSDAGAIGEAVSSRRVVHIPDFLQVHDPAREPDYLFARVQPLVGFRTVLVVPMLREQAAIGAIVIWRNEPRPFAEQQIELLKTFADQAVIAIENVRLFSELQEKNRQVGEALEQQTATAEILGVISSSPTDLNPVFDAVIAKATRLCDAHLGLLGLYDGHRYRNVRHQGASAEFEKYLFEGSPPEYDQATGIGRMIHTRQPVHIVDLTQEPAYRSGNPARMATVHIGGARTFLAVPMLKEGDLVGGLVIYRSEVRPFTDDQIALVQTFANQAVIAIENVRLFTELQERTRDLARSVEQLTALGEVSRAVSSTLDLDRVLSTIVTRASQLSGAEGCSIYEYDEAVDGFRMRATQQITEEVLETQRASIVRRGEGVLGRLPETRAPVQVADIADEQTYQSPLRDALVRGGYRALLAIPMLHEDRVVGGLVVSRTTPGEFPPETVEVLKTFANQSALAIQNARLFREIEEQSRQLEIANRHKSEFLANMSHELRTPLNAVIGFSEVLVERMYGEINEKQEEYLRDIYSSGRHLLSLINDILDLAKIEAGRMELEVTKFDLPQAIENALTLVRGRADAHAIRLESEIDAGLGDFAGDERKFKQILLNLLSNAVKFTPEGGRVSLRAGLQNGSVEVSVVDTGIGIAAEDQPAVFEEFRQVGTDYARKREGTGLGLALTKRFVELHGGAIWLKSAPGEGSTFTFTLPVRAWPTSSS